MKSRSDCEVRISNKFWPYLLRELNSKWSAQTFYIFSESNVISYVSMYIVNMLYNIVRCTRVNTRVISILNILAKKNRQIYQKIYPQTKSSNLQLRPLKISPKIVFKKISCFLGGIFWWIFLDGRSFYHLEFFLRLSNFSANFKNPKNYIFYICKEFSTTLV